MSNFQVFTLSRNLNSSLVYHNKIHFRWTADIRMVIERAMKKCCCLSVFHFSIRLKSLHHPFSFQSFFVLRSLSLYLYVCVLFPVNQYKKFSFGKQRHCCRTSTQESR